MKIDKNILGLNESGDKSTKFAQEIKEIIIEEAKSILGLSEHDVLLISDLHDSDEISTSDLNEFEQSCRDRVEKEILEKYFGEFEPSLNFSGLGTTAKSTPELNDDGEVDNLICTLFDDTVEFNWNPVDWSLLFLSKSDGYIISEYDYKGSFFDFLQAFEKFKKEML